VKPSVELAALRWVVIVLFGLQMVQFVRPVASAAPAGGAMPNAPVVATLDARVAALEHAVSLLQSNDKEFQNVYYHHGHSLAMLVVQRKPDVACNSSIAVLGAGLNQICTLKDNYYLNFVTLPDGFSGDWSHTGPPIAAK